MDVNFFKQIFRITQPDIELYAEDHTSDEDDLLYKVNRKTHLHSLRPRMLSGKFQGQLLRFLSNLQKPKNILEIGTYTGYSALCLINGMKKDGRLHTIEINPELEKTILENFSEHPRHSDFKLHIGDALDIIPQIKEKWDLVFIDAQKTEYLKYYDLIKPLMNKNGLIIFDNVLWGGKVLEDIETTDQKTATLIALNKHIQEDNDVDNILMPVRDGLMMVYIN